MPLIRVWEVKQSLNYYCLYALVFFLPAVAFSCLFVDFESCPFLFLSVTIYYSLIKNLISDKSPFALFISGFILKWLATLFLPTAPSFILKWPATLFLPIAKSQGLVIFLFWWWLMTFLLLELSTKLSSLLLNILDNGTTFFYNSSSCPNTYFNTCFYSIMRIFSFYIDLIFCPSFADPNIISYSMFAQLVCLRAGGYKVLCTNDFFLTC